MYLTDLQFTKVNILFPEFVFLTREKLSQLGPTSLMVKALWVLGRGS